MTHPPLLDFEALAAPISDAQPCGSSYESGENGELTRVFSELRALTQNARRIEARKFELESVWPSLSPQERADMLLDAAQKTDGPKADPQWGRISQLAIDILTKSSKDTRALVSLIEAMTCLHGLPGLRDALRLGALMLEKFQLALFPVPEPKVPHHCLTAIAKVCESENYTIKSTLYQADIFENDPRWSWFSHIAATNLDKRPLKEKEALQQAGELTLEDFNRTLNEINKSAELIDFDQQLTEALSEAKVLDDLMGKQSEAQVGVTRLIEDLAKQQRWYRGVIEDRLQALVSQEQSATAENGAQENASEGQPSASGRPNSEGPQGAISSREQALARLLQVATYFRNSEPHSPLSYALEQAVRWGRMPLPDLLRDLVDNEGVLADMYRRMGIVENKEKS